MCFESTNEGAGCAECLNDDKTISTTPKIIITTTYYLYTFIIPVRVFNTKKFKFGSNYAFQLFDPFVSVDGGKLPAHRKQAPECFGKTGGGRSQGPKAPGCLRNS